MKLARATIVVGTGLLLVAASLAAETHSQARVLIADPYFWTGPEGNLGLEITGKFQSEEKLQDTLRLKNEIGYFKDKKSPYPGRIWILRDILVSVDFNATGSVAIWRVSGPKPLITSYVEGLKRQYKDKSLFYDFGYQVVNFKPSAD